MTSRNISGAGHGLNHPGRSEAFNRETRPVAAQYGFFDRAKYRIARRRRWVSAALARSALPVCGQASPMPATTQLADGSALCDHPGKAPVHTVSRLGVAADQACRSERARGPLEGGRRVSLPDEARSRAAFTERPAESPGETVQVVPRSRESDVVMSWAEPHQSRVA
jgi:hypothetical protein